MLVETAAQPANAAPIVHHGALPAMTSPADLVPIFGVVAARCTLRRWESEGKWPKRIHLGHKTVVWKTAEIIAHLGIDPSVVVAAWQVARSQAGAA